ncbi:MAG TPA: serine hydrolase domain-containing protein [Ktedonobacterales bacterium]|nr:serine hydrolase domain-containing protein [Ktedonobacterales bacterium]
MAEQQTQIEAASAVDEALTERVRAAMARWHIPGATVGILADGARREQGFGIVSLETEYAVRADTLFQIGSITKLFTATLVMLLVEEGKLALDTPVTTYLPELKLADADAQARITLRMLLSHTAGFFGDFFDDFGPGDDALSAYIARLHTLEQQTPPGESWAYNNAGFCLAGAIIERVTGARYEQAVRERIFKPLGMTRSFLFAHEAIAYPNAVGHTQKTPRGEEHEVARLYPLPRAVNAAGGIISTVDDLLTFAQFQLDGGVTRDGQRLLSEETIRAMWQPQIKAANFAEAYGIGWETREIDGVRLIGHGGSTNGFNARLTIIPERNFAIAILTNSGRGSAMYGEVIEAELQERFGLREPKPQPISLPQEALARLAGSYIQPDERVTLTATADGLRVEITAHDVLNDKDETYPPQDLRPISPAEFIVVTPGEDIDARIDFLLDDDAHPRYVRIGGRLAKRAE